ncbi:Secondary metabolism regulator LAE1 [Colletotrichum trifolii]|uniref:Secondary metabolism regulator LAE1 n=1 Tax=Colletotrichum trifolii TaxID=5466 RepID=A0A4R8RIS2_COLTR|nr:Secondary metabolism regulator LAE1 [Colletotrichum trifolii]
MSNNDTSAPVEAEDSAPAANTNNDVLAADDDTDVSSDASSVRGSIATSNTSLAQSVLEYREENGRTYHSYKEGKYFAPNDIREIDRLDLQHNLFLKTFDDRLGTAPPNDKDSKVKRVLDVGTGSGLWAIDFGDEHPEAEVTGVDLSAVRDTFVPPNVKFEVDDVEEPWTYSEPFDYIHSRIMTGSITDWEKYIRNCYDNLALGGYLELNEIDASPVSDDGTIDNTAITKSVDLTFQAMEIFGSPFQEFSRFEKVLKDIGFDNVHIQQFKWPTNSWPKDPKHKELGLWVYDTIAYNLESFMMAPLTRALNWTKEEVLVLATEMRRDMADKNIHAYYNV